MKRLIERLNASGFAWTLEERTAILVEVTEWLRDCGKDDRNAPHYCWPREVEGVERCCVEDLADQLVAGGA